MALYRNIAGLDPYSQVGLLLNLKDAFTPPIVPATPMAVDTQPPTGGGLMISQPNVVQILPPGTPWSGGNVDLQANQQAIRDAFAALASAKQGYYNYLLSTSPYDLTQAGYYVDPDGTVFMWTDAAHTKAVVYLALQDIQDIENTAGTAGTLFMHMGLPILAKDTAGYAGGGRASQGATTMYSTPIADVLAIPATPTGPNVVNDYNPPETFTPEVIPGGGEDTTPKPGTGVPTTTDTPTATLVSGNTLGIVALGLAVIGVARSRKLLLVGGLGLLYYSMSKTQNS
jgi:hypothetical protein